MRKKKEKKIRHLSFNADGFKWCVDNDFQVYLVPIHMGRFKIAVRRGGITTEGKDALLVDGVYIQTTEVLSKSEYMSVNEATIEMNLLYDKLKLKYKTL